MMPVQSAPTSVSEPTVFIVEDDDSARDGLREMFSPLGVQIHAFPTAEAFLSEFTPNGPACLLVDERLPGMNGTELLRQLRRDGVRTPSVLVTAYATTSTTVEAMQQGATTVLDKPCPEGALQSAVRAALELDQDRIERERPRKTAKEKLSKLSDSEWQVLRMVLNGVPNKQIASKLGVCVRTVEARRSRIYQSTSVGSVAELVRMCVAAGAVDDPDAPQPAADV
jgi:two-component system CheB/CheR fusion protein